MSRPSIQDQLTAAGAEQLGDVEIRLRAPDGTIRTLACFGRATSAMAAEIVKTVNKITEGNRA